MKIEMGESLFYSWLRHVKECQVVQTNWKPSPSWQLQNEEELKRFMDTTDAHFQNKYGYGIYKNNSLSQLLLQAEVDALGLSLSDNGVEIYAIDVAFHERGLNYGDRQETVMRIIKKFARTALCLIGYFGVTQGEIIFSSPKIHNAIINDLEPCTADLNAIFLENNYHFTARIIANDDFNELVLKPILIASDGVSDTSELFMRGYQLINMFGNERRPSRQNERQSSRQRTQESEMPQQVSSDTLSELKIGKIAQTFLREALESGKANDEEINLMRKKDYSKSQFGIDFPLLVLASDKFDSKRYYAKPLMIRGVQYRLCSQWYEVSANNDRPFLLAWLDRHDALI
ncbi:MAG: hypothetical protein LBR21_00145 [Propionibacteriaceae bacterium]|jgi:hypothetical protein|nr:hypothetical protein [Propionibacteriaceae bacterium]